jgi:pyruvyl transferase EpsO
MRLADDLRNELGSKINAILAPLLHGNDARICLIDPPGHPNVGDCAILLGELDYLERHHPHSKLSFYDVDSYTPRADKYINEANILLIHGGGNFGDIWPHHHEIRKTILRNFRHKKVVQLPQSIKFSDEAELRETQKLIEQHPDFHLIVRDTKSYEFARKTFSCEVSLSPDMAFAMRPIQRAPASVDFHCLLRTDKEVAADHWAIKKTLTSLGATFAIDDWLSDPATFSRRLDHRLKFTTRENPALTAPFQSQMLAARRNYARRRLDYGISLLSRGRYVVTDRLHAHILSSLLDIPNFVFDSFDGKISALHRTWTAGRTLAWMVNSPAELKLQIDNNVERAAQAA